MCSATLDSLNETESNFGANISSPVYTFRGAYYNAFSKKNHKVLHFTSAYLFLYSQRYRFTIYINIWPFARTQLATNDGTQCQNTHADVNYFSV
jgi:hypothetical protein